MKTKMLHDLRSVKGDHFYNPYQKSLDLPEAALGQEPVNPDQKLQGRNPESEKSQRPNCTFEQKVSIIDSNQRLFPVFSYSPTPYAVLKY